MPTSLALYIAVGISALSVTLAPLPASAKASERINSVARVVQVPASPGGAPTMTVPITWNLL